VQAAHHLAGRELCKQLTISLDRFVSHPKAQNTPVQQVHELCRFMGYVLRTSSSAELGQIPSTQKKRFNEFILELIAMVC
jgi:hypothetical protein